MDRFTAWHKREVSEHKGNDKLFRIYKKCNMSN